MAVLLAADWSQASAAAVITRPFAAGAPAWALPFAPASPAQLAGLQTALQAGTGEEPLSRIADLGAVPALSPEAAGALLAHLPQALSREAVAAAYQAAVPEVAAALEARAA